MAGDAKSLEVLAKLDVLGVSLVHLVKSGVSLGALLDIFSQVKSLAAELPDAAGEIGGYTWSEDAELFAAALQDFKDILSALSAPSVAS